MSATETSADADGIFEPFDDSRVPVEEFTRGSRFGIRLTGESYRKSATLEYWEGVDDDDKGIR